MFIFLTKYDSCVQVEQLVVTGDLMSEEPQGFLKACAYPLVYIFHCCFYAHIIQED